MYKGAESRKVPRASWEVPQQSRPAASCARDRSTSPEPTLSVQFIIKESFNPNIKDTVDACLTATYNYAFHQAFHLAQFREISGQLNVFSDFICHMSEQKDKDA